MSTGILKMLKELSLHYLKITKLILAADLSLLPSGPFPVTNGELLSRGFIFSKF